MSDHCYCETRFRASVYEIEKLKKANKLLLETLKKEHRLFFEDLHEGFDAPYCLTCKTITQAEEKS